MDSTVLTALIAAIAASVVTPIINAIIGRMKRKNEAKECQSRISVEDINSMKMAMQLLLVDKVTYLTECAVKGGEITIRQRAFIHQMIDAAHVLGANGEMTQCGEVIDELPVK